MPVARRDFRNPPVVAAERVMAGRFAAEQVQGDEQLVVS